MKYLFCKTRIWWFYNTIKIPFIVICLDTFTHFYNVFVVHYKNGILKFHLKTFHITLNGILFQKNYTKNCVGQYFLDIEANRHPLHISFINFSTHKVGLNTYFSIDFKCTFHLLFNSFAFNFLKTRLL
jgi:hypothetical protein